tara:strand:+ start:425 stop:589 length:165 start_codon:yes stop_codon:yes gene_type:complete
MNLVNDNFFIANLDLNQEDLVKDLYPEKILCNHCKRSLNNGKKCIGMCVADSEY